MRNMVIELARAGGELARSHFRSGSLSSTTKGRSDYVSHVDRQVEAAITSRIRAHYPDHCIIGEENIAGAPQNPSDSNGPCWIIDPIDGTTNFLRGIASFAVSIAFCDKNMQPQVGVVYDPIAEELFVGERNAGFWCGQQRIYNSGCKDISQALIATALPFRHLESMKESLAAMGRIQVQADDLRRSGSAALDLAYVAMGRLDAYYELGIWAWDTAAGELLVRCSGGVASDFAGKSDALLQRRSIIAAATPTLHADIYELLGDLKSWVDKDPYRGTSAQASSV